MKAIISANMLKVIIRLDRLERVFTNRDVVNIAGEFVGSPAAVAQYLNDAGMAKRIAPNQYELTENAYREITSMEKELEL